MKHLLSILLVCVALTAFPQRVDKIIKEKDVTRIISTLAADDMMGRSATRPEHIDKAAAFIANEFKAIGLSYMDGLTGFRQEFVKTKISDAHVEVSIDGQPIDTKNTLLISEKKEIQLTSGLQIKSILYDPTLTNKEEYFFGKAFPIAQDTVSTLILIAPEFESAFMEYKGFFRTRFGSEKKSTKVYVLGKTSATTYAVRATQNVESVRMANVVGVLPGKAKASEMVVFSGHYDHIGIRPAIEGDSIANGADDDASGTTAVIELARYFKKVKNNSRTLVFVALTAEESGGHGAKYFSSQVDPNDVVAMFNIEMIGKPSKWGSNAAFITGFEKSDFGEILQQNVKGTPFQFHPDPYPEQDLFYRSDNATLARLGVPAHTISTDEIDIDKYYHTVNDEVSTLDMKNLTLAIRSIAVGAASIVDGRDTPKRIDKAGVR